MRDELKVLLAALLLFCVSACSSQAPRTYSDSTSSEEASPARMDPEAVRQVIRSGLKEIKSCYEVELAKSSAKIEGKLVVKFEVAKGGVVQKASVKKSELKNETMENCVLAVIQAKKFPEPPEGTIAQIDYPFVFGYEK
jgi:TonB family protein